MDSLDDGVSVEVDQQPQLEAGKSKVRQELCAMDIGHAVYRLQFHNDRPFDDEVSPESSSDFHALVDGRNRDFSLKTKVALLQFEGKCTRVSGLQEPDAKHL